MEKAERKGVSGCVEVRGRDNHGEMNGIRSNLKQEGVEKWRRCSFRDKVILKPCCYRGGFD